MRNVSETSSTRNHVVVAVVALSLLMMSIPQLSQIQAGGNSFKTSASTTASRYKIQTKVIERKNLLGSVQSRIQVEASGSNGEFQFKVDDFQLREQGQLFGAGRISDSLIKLNLKDEKTGMEIGLRLKLDSTTERLIAKISLNGQKHQIAFDLAKARSLAAEMQQLVSDGKREEAVQARRQISATLSPRAEYLAFVRNVINSSSAGVLNRAGHVLATLSQEEIAGNPAIAVMRSAFRILVPSSWNADTVDKTVVGAQQQASIQRVGYSRKASAIKAASLQSGVSCGACSPIALTITLGCFYLAATCPYDPLVCDLLIAACFGGAVASLVLCEENCV